MQFYWNRHAVFPEFARYGRKTKEEYMEYLVVYSVWELDRSIELGQTKVMVEILEVKE